MSLLSRATKLTNRKQRANQWGRQWSGAALLDDARATTHQPNTNCIIVPRQLVRLRSSVACAQRAPARFRDRSRALFAPVRSFVAPIVHAKFDFNWQKRFTFDVAGFVVFLLLVCFSLQGQINTAYNNTKRKTLFHPLQTLHHRYETSLLSACIE